MSVVDELVTLLGLKTDPGAKREATGFAKVLGFVQNAALAVGGALVAAAGAVQAYGLRQAETIAGQYRQAEALGITFERMQELEFAASSLGGQAAELTADLLKLTSSMSSPIPGEYNQTLYLLGVNARKASGELKTADEVLLDVADRLQGMSKQRQMQFAERLGLSGTSLKLIQSGRAGVAQLAAQARALGVVLDQGAGEQAAKLQRGLVVLRASVDGLGRAITSGLLPGLEGAVRWATEWLGANRKIIASGVRQVVEGTARGFRMVGDALAWVWSQVEKLTGPLGGLVKGLDATQLIAGLTATAITLLGVSAALAALPVILLTAKILAIALVIEDLYALLSGGESFFGEFAAAMKEEFPAIGAVFEAISETLAELMFMSAHELPRELESAAEKIMSIFRGIVDFVDTVVGTIKEIPSVLRSIGDFLAPGLQISAAAVASSVPPGVLAGAARGAGGQAGGSPTIIVNGAGDPRAVGDEVVRRGGLGESLQSMSPGPFGPMAF